MLNLGFFLRFL